MTLFLGLFCGMLVGDDMAGMEQGAWSLQVLGSFMDLVI